MSLFGSFFTRDFIRDAHGNLDRERLVRRVSGLIHMDMCQKKGHFKGIISNIGYRQFLDKIKEYTICKRVVIGPSPKKDCILQGSSLIVNPQFFVSVIPNIKLEYYCSHVLSYFIVKAEKIHIPTLCRRL